MPPIQLPDYDTARQGLTLDVPDDYNFGFDLIDWRADHADKVAFIYAAPGQAPEHYRFSALKARSNRFANVLRAAGARKGDHAFMMIPRIPAWYETMIGCFKLGVVAMPGTNLLMPKDIEYRINKARASLAIVTVDHADKIAAIRDKCPTLKTVIVIGGDPLADTLHYDSAMASASDDLDRDALPKTRADEVMMAYFTSGTTAFPKMVPRSHAYALAHALTARYWQDLGQDDVHWTLSDTGWAKAAWGMIFGQWQMGATILLYDPGPGFDAAVLLGQLAEHKVSTFCAPPTVYRAFAQLDLGQFDLSSVRHSFSAGEPLNPEVIRIWKDATGTEVHDGYGQTETICVAANVPGVPVRPGSMGRAMPGIPLDIVDDSGAVCPDQEVGHIAIKLTDPYPPGLFQGYFEDDEANAACFRNGWYYTGDTAYRDEDGYIWFVGRADDLISSSGYRISPFEVESALVEHAAVAESAVVGKKDAMRGELVKAYIVLADGYQGSPALEKEIQDFVKSVTAPYKYPREITFMTELPKTVSGKIRRVELRDQANAE